MYKFFCSSYPNLTISGNPEIQFKGGYYFTKDEDIVKRINVITKSILITKELIKDEEAKEQEEQILKIEEDKEKAKVVKRGKHK